ncbi:D-ribose pyranase [Halocella sp. SP3-1]|uniref:D-ribose pyranase n=1 Tax=Halocella sp. SP3-1 TaxID=2382161 RepID=UPI000F76191C|nr:D-ribose pyranase [Halocella sp. SP3-1]AZO94959.1 D-ribose pyranase [Halocella sp. SP3-1]
MKRKGILNREVSRVIASMGHGQFLLVCDAGFPIPQEADCVDLAIKKGLPDLPTVLSTINKEFISEKVMCAPETKSNNQPLYDELKKIFKEVDFEDIPHEKILKEIAYGARAIIRTGDYNPWGNIVLQAGTDPYAWFEKESLKMPDFYKQRIKNIEEADKRDMFYKSEK